MEGTEGGHSTKHEGESNNSFKVRSQLTEALANEASSSSSHRTRSLSSSGSSVPTSAATTTTTTAATTTSTATTSSLSSSTPSMPPSSSTTVSAPMGMPKVFNQMKQMNIAKSSPAMPTHSTSSQSSYLSSSPVSISPILKGKKREKKEKKDKKKSGVVVAQQPSSPRSTSPISSYSSLYSGRSPKSSKKNSRSLERDQQRRITSGSVILNQSDGMHPMYASPPKVRHMSMSAAAPPSIVSGSTPTQPSYPNESMLINVGETFFQQGFLQYLELGSFSDILLVDTANNREYKAHCLMLAYSSEYFAKILFQHAHSLTQTQTQTQSQTSTKKKSKRSRSKSSSSVRTKKSPSSSLIHQSTEGKPSASLSSTSLSGSSTSVPSPATESPESSTIRTVSTTTTPPPIEIIAKLDKEEKKNAAAEPATTTTSSSCNHSIRRLELPFPDSNNVFPDVLKYMYSGIIDITPDNSIPILALADLLMISDLKMLASQYIAANIQRHNALSMLEKAMKFNSESIIDKCLTVIAKNFCYIYDADYCFLPLHLFMKIVHHPTLAIKSERALYDIIRNYVAHHRDELDTSHINTLMEAIRFRWLTRTELKEIVENPLVPRDLLVEALMAKLSDYETIPSSPTTVVNKRLQKRETYGIAFEWMKEYDGIGGTANRGILYWIATNCGRNEWQNPHFANRMFVQASSIEKGQPMELVSRHPTELWTSDVPASWFSIDLGKGRSVIPNYYTLRHGGNYRADSLRTWDLQGSFDGITWSVLKRHTNDCSLNGPFATHSWPVVGINTAYRYFRILQTGHNSSNHNFLVLSGFELYGELFEM